MRRQLPFLLILVCGALLGGTRVVQLPDLRLLDFQFRFLRAVSPQPAARDVVVIGVDEETAARFSEPITLWHGHFGRLLTVLALAKPAAVGLDIVLPDRSYDTVLPGMDKLLLKGLLDARQAFPVVLGQTVEPSGRPRAIHPPFLRIAGNSGYALFPVDPDGVVRRFDERLGEEDKAVPTLVGEMARKLGADVRSGVIDYWRGSPIQYVPMHQVLQWAEAGDVQTLARVFADKPVLVGMVFQFEDRLSAPVQLAAWDSAAPNTPGVLLHAQTLRNLLGRGPIQSAPVAAVAVVCIALAALWFVSAGAGVVALLLGAIVLLLGAVSTWLLAQGWLFPSVAPALTATLALGGRHVHDTLLKLRERRRLRASFGGYVSPSVMEEILAGHIQPELGGVSQDVCVLFSDIRGYTTRSERMTPEAIIEFLNRYFERTVALIHRRGGAVMCFMGDGIMAVFGAPKALDNPCRDAFEAALAMLAYVAELNAEFHAEGEAPIDIGIGLHFGAAVVGHVGSSSRHDYTAIGDVINVASRLESLTKEAGYRIVVSHVVAERLDGEAGLVPLGPMAIKGHSPVEVYGYDKN